MRQSHLNGIKAGKQETTNQARKKGRREGLQREAMKKGRKQTNNDATKTARKRCGEKASRGNN